MIEIKNKVIKEQKSFWNQCVFHPTDAVEDPWGRRILDRMSRDGSIDTVRIYAMFEDIVYRGENGELLYDFRLSDLRLDYLTGLGYNLVIAYAGVPDCIARTDYGRSSVAKNKTRYKGKMWNTNTPTDYKLWEDVCYEYTKHIYERYGERVVNKWRVHCFNEPDMPCFFLSGVEDVEDKSRADEYLLMYEAFVKGVRRACKGIRVGGPALAVTKSFLKYFLTGVKERGLEMDYIAIHTYGTSPEFLNSGEDILSVNQLLEKQERLFEIIKKCGFCDTPITIDEWGASSHGFFNSEECKILMFRETEIYSAYFVRLICEMIKRDKAVDNFMICLSGQHEMTEDFSGFRNFFTLNFIAKPIYNSYILTSKLGKKILESEADRDAISVIPTKNDNGDYAVAVAYSVDGFSESLESYVETVNFDEDIVGKKVTVWCIDKEHTNPYRLYQKLGINDPTEDEIKLLREEGRLKPVSEFLAQSSSVEIKMSANAVFLITVGE